MTDKEIIEGCKRNDRKCQEALYRRYFPKMISLCFRFASDRDTAMMIVNDGFMKVYLNIEKFEFRGSFEGWVRKLVFRSVSDYYRKENSYLKFLLFEPVESITDSSILSELYFEDILKLTDKLSDKSRKVFQYYAIDGYAHKEIAKMLDMSEGTSKWYLSEARKHLKELIKKQQLRPRDYAG